MKFDVRRMCFMVCLWVMRVSRRVEDEAGKGSGTVLDMHAEQGKRGVYFEDPHWWTHLAALKPIGLTCLLAEPKHPEVSAFPSCFCFRARLSSNRYDDQLCTTARKTDSYPAVCACCIIHG